MKIERTRNRGDVRAFPQRLHNVLALPLGTQTNELMIMTVQLAAGKEYSHVIVLLPGERNCIKKSSDVLEWVPSTDEADHKCTIGYP
jgi:hypothetical protein